MHEKAGKRSSFSDVEVSRIITLLTSTDLTEAEIAGRMRCTPSAVISLNKKLGVRHQSGLRATWDYPVPVEPSRHLYPTSRLGSV